MDISTITELTEGTMVTTFDASSINIEFAMASDLMSDVLTLDTENTMLITGLSNIQTIRTAEMSDVNCIVLARNKRSTPEMLKIANEIGIVIIESSHAMYLLSGILYAKGIKAIY